MTFFHIFLMCEVLTKSMASFPTAIFFLNFPASLSPGFIYLYFNIPNQVVALSKRSKEAEAAFLSVYKQLIEAPGTEDLANFPGINFTRGFP